MAQFQPQIRALQLGVSNAAGSSLQMAEWSHKKLVPPDDGLKRPVNLARIGRDEEEIGGVCSWPATDENETDPAQAVGFGIGWQLVASKPTRHACTSAHARTCFFLEDFCLVSAPSGSRSLLSCSARCHRASFRQTQIKNEPCDKRSQLCRR